MTKEDQLQHLLELYREAMTALISKEHMKWALLNREIIQAEKALSSGENITEPLLARIGELKMIVAEVEKEANRLAGK